MAQAPPLPARFPFWTEEKLRIADTDMNGHINNGAIGAYCEAGRAEVLHEIAGPPPDRSVAMVVARVEIDYLRELHYPGRVRIGTAVSRIGTSSFGLEQALYSGEACFAAARSVMVVMDHQTRRPIPIPAALRDVLTRLEPIA
ncbi:MAG: thioesterase [Belnapia sp.]|jgi:acyl-CoA thioester hydrolase|nr:thioesterase [Belnapia sp.]